MSVRLWVNIRHGCTLPRGLNTRRGLNMRIGLKMALGLILLVGVTACGTRNPATAPTSGASSATAPVAVALVAHPDLSGFWNLDMSVARDDDLMKQVAPNTAFLDDTGPKEFPAGDFGGLKLKPAALEAARKWDPYSQLTPENACKAPSIVYAMQGPFPIEIFQSDKLIVMKLEYYDMMRILFLDGRQPESDYPASKEGFSSAHWEGATLVVETTHLEPATITNNGLDHTGDVRVIERFKLSPDGKKLLATQEFEDPAIMENRGVRFIAWRKEPGQHVFPYECDPGFAGNYSKPVGKPNGKPTGHAAGKKTPP